MKRVLYGGLFGILIILISSSVQGAELSFSKKNDIALLELEGMKKESYLSLLPEKQNIKEIHFNLSIDDVELFEQPDGAYLKVSNLTPYTKPGEPMLPMKTFVVKLPKNSEISDVYAYDGRYRKLNNKVNIISTPQPHTVSAKKTAVSINKINPNYNLGSYFPGKIISYDTGSDNENTYLLVRFFPVQYIPEQNEATLITDVKIRVEYKETPPVKNLLPEVTSRCVIITHEELKVQADELANFHNSTNISTTVITTQQIWDSYNASTDPGYEGYKNSSIGGWDNITAYNYTLAKKIISFLNEQSNSNLEYVVLFGNGKYIPPSYYIYDIDFRNCDCFTCWGVDYYNSWVPTDFFYVSPDYDLIPNYKLGRVPVNDTAEAEHFVNKTKNWHSNVNWTWFKNFAAIGGRAFVKTECGRYDELFTSELASVEIINKYLNGMNTTKLFLSSGNYDKINVKNIYFGNYGFIYHFSHGSGDGMWKHHGNWTELVNASEIGGLPENYRMPVVVSPACMNGAFDTNLYPNDRYGYVQQESFAESLLNSKAGGIAYFGGARNNYAGMEVYLKEGYLQIVKQRYMNGMLDGIFKGYHKGKSTLGELSSYAITNFIINNEILDNELNSRTLFEYTFLGDPVLAIPQKQEIIEPERPELSAVNPLNYTYDNIGLGADSSVGDLPIYPLFSNATVTCTSESENVKIKLIDTSEIFNNTNITDFNLSNNPNNYINYTFNLTEPHAYLVRCIDDNDKEGWLYTKTDLKKAEIVGNYADYVQDTDNDSLYDYLTINVTINVTEAGIYTLESYLLVYETDNNYGYFPEVIWIFLDEGMHTIPIDFDGYEIYRIGVYGDYYLGYIRLYDGVILIDSISEWVYETEGVYLYTDFEDRNHTFTQPYSNYNDYGIDINNNSLYDYLAINITVNISNEGYYIIDGLLWTEGYTDHIRTSDYVYLHNGTQNIDLKFLGYKIYNWETDGPYSLEGLCIYDSNGTEIECIFANEGYDTSFYNPPQFEHNPPSFTNLFTNFSDSISNSYYEDNGIVYRNLVVNITVNISEVGAYIIVGELYDENGTLITQSGSIYHLDSGTQTIQLNFSGSKIYDNGADGNYYLKELYLKDANGTVMDYRENAYSTLHYNYSQFRMPPDLAVVNISFNSTELAAGENVTIFGLIENLMTVNDKDLEGVNISLFVDDICENSKIINLRNKYNATVNFSWIADAGGHDITVVVDENNEIDETNESNNNLTVGVITCSIPGDDMYINEDTVLCGRVYDIDDSGDNGAIIINASDVVLDCNGASLNGIGTGYGTYLENKNNVTIKNCNVMNYEYGIYLWKSPNNTITDDAVSDNNYGVLLDHSPNNTITSNTVNNCTYRGIYLLSSSNNTMINNTVSDNGEGIYLHSSSNNNISHNMANSNDIGIYLWKASNNTITANTASDNYYGISLHSSSNNNQIINNTANDNSKYGYGIYLHFSLNNAITANTANKNKYYGIVLLEYSSNNTIANNTANDNRYGISLYTSLNNTLQNNEISNNNIGIYSQNSTSTIISNFVCGNSISDFNGSDWLNSSGTNNICVNADGWNDTGTTGCSFSCSHYILHLKPGWNLVSIPIQPTSTSLWHVLDPIQGKFDKVFAYKGRWIYKALYDEVWYGDLDKIESGTGYWIYANDEVNLTVYGYLPDKNISLGKGWSLIGWLSNETVPVVDALVSINDSYNKVFTYAQGMGWVYKALYDGIWYGDLSDMEPGRGYWIYMKEGGVLQVQ